MKHLLQFILCTLLLCACNSSNIGENPTKDGQEMMFQAMTELKNGNSDKANEIIGEYVNVYTSKSFADKEEFAKGSSETYWNEMAVNHSPEWAEFITKMRPLMQWYMTSGEALSSLPNFNRLKELQMAVINK